MTPRLLLRVHMALLLCLLTACASAPQLSAATPRPIPDTSAGYLASVKLADITPPLHLSLFGHGPESRVATGVRTRLRCEVFVLAGASDIVALVPCDLQSISMALQRAVAAKLAHYGVPIGADRLFLMATHTHAGPAHYFEARRYSESFSSALPGYDPTVVDFLAGRIAGAIVDAFASLEPACLGWQQRKLEGLTYNRSYVPFLANKQRTRAADADPSARASAAERAQQALTAPIEPNTPQALGRTAPTTDEGTVLSGPEVAVDPRLSVLNVARRAPDAVSCKDARLIGVLAVYGMHPTGVPNTNDLYHGDIYGFATRAAEGRLSLPAQANEDRELAAWATESALVFPESERVIVGLANGVEGDVSPKLMPQSFSAARRHGRALGAAIANLSRTLPSESLHSQGPLKHLSWDLHFPQGQFADDAGSRLCKSAELGVAAGGGANDGPTRLRILPEANAGYRLKHAQGCHGHKLPLRAGAATHFDFPEIAPIGLTAIADGLLANAPGEMTTVTGQRIRDGIVARLAHTAFAHDQPLVLVGLTNQYLQYFATREEYDFQYYEGASTLYGPDSEAFLTRHFARLADALVGRDLHTRPQPQLNAPEVIAMDPRPVRRWPADQEIDVLDLEPAHVKRLLRDGTLGWELEIDRLPLLFTSDRNLFQVQIIGLLHGVETVLDDDRGASVEVREIEHRRWRVRWIPDLSADDARCGRSFKIAVSGRNQVISEAFPLTCPRVLP